MKNLIIDFANLTAITRFGLMAKNSNNLMMSDDDWLFYFVDSMLVTLANYINVLKSDRIILALENKSWRKTFYPLYKENRTAAKEADEKLELFYKATNIVAEFMNDYTNSKVIRALGAEGDDIIAVLAQKLSTDGEKVTIVSTDGDFKQLLRYKGVKIFDPIKKVYKTEYSHRDYVTKIIKGDAGDNIPSSYPRIKQELLDQILLDEKYLINEFKKVENQIERQKFFICQFLDIEEIPDDLSEDEWDEIFKLAREKREKITAKVKEAKTNGILKESLSLLEKDKKIKTILKLAKNEDISEAKLFSKIIRFEEAFKRNEKLICLKIDNIPEYVTENILKEFSKTHSAAKQNDFLKFVRKFRLKEFAFGSEWNILKNIRDI